MTIKTKIVAINAQFPELDKITHCAKVLRQGGLVIFPTETVYGIAADFNNDKAMERLREVKRRSANKPFSVLISQKGLISNYTSLNEPPLFKLIDEYWPGPLTVIVPNKKADGTIGIRIPNHNIALKLVQESQCTIAAPSANFEGNPAPTTCQEALRDMDGLVDLAIDGGKSPLGQASTVVDFTKLLPTVLREGVIKQLDVDRITQRKNILFVCTGNSCRSVMAEYLLRSRVKDRNDVEVLSAGTSVYLRTPASAETISLLRKDDIDASHHLSQPLTHILLKKSDLILVMTRSHRQQVLEWVPSVEKRVYLLKEFALTKSSDVDLDIPDPIGRSAEAYAECMLIIKDAIEKLIKLI